MMPARQWMIAGALAAAALLLVGLWRSATAEPMAGFRDFPWTYVTEGMAGYDPSRVVIARGEITGPQSVEDASGATAWPAYVHPDPKVVPLKDGKPYIFPVIDDGHSQRTPVILPLKRPLNAREIGQARRFQTPEGEERLQRFRQEMQQ